jgi:hypothetical protein
MNAKDGLGTYGHLSPSEEIATSLTAPSPDEVAKPASAVVRVMLWLCCIISKNVPTHQKQYWAHHCFDFLFDFCFCFVRCFFTTIQPMIEIVAPATLMEGYRLDAQVGNSVMTVTIPLGGVEKGQKFSVPVPVSSTHDPTAGALPAVQKMNIPVGQWKDGLCDCCRHGCCHAHCCVSYWVPALGAGQVISRLQLNWLGKPTNSQAQKASAFTTLFTISMIYIGMRIFLWLLLNSMIPFDPNEEPPAAAGPFALLNQVVIFGYYLLSVVVIYNLRYV